MSSKWANSAARRRCHAKFRRKLCLILNLRIDCAGSTGELLRWARELRASSAQDELNRESAYLYSVEDFDVMLREQAT